MDGRCGYEGDRMRLIDADALIEKMEADTEYIDEPIGKMFAYAAINDVKHAPTIEPQRMRGKWIPQGWNDTYIKCSCCEEVYVELCVPMGFTYNFCPNCGAEMEQG